MSQLLQIEATISKVMTMSKGALRLQVDTQEEVSDEKSSKIMATREKIGWFNFMIDSKIQEKDIVNTPILIKDDANKKSPSQQLRDRMYVYYISTHTDKTKFNAWYLDTLEQIGKQYLDKIDNNYPTEE